jgi:membrane protein
VSLGTAISRLRDEARAMTARDALRELLRAYDSNDLLTFASAIAFQVFFALIPLMLFGIALMGVLGLDEIWTDNLAPDLKKSASPEAYKLIDDTVLKVLDQRLLFWITAGAVIAVWEMSGAVRAIMDAFDRIYGSRRDRPFVERYRVSTLLALGAGLLVLAAAAVLQIGPSLVEGLAFSIARWLIAAVLLSVAITLLVSFAPSRSRPPEWVSFGSVVVVVAWLGTSIAFTAYLTQIADYGNVFGALATIIIVFEYLYLAAIAFLTGAQVDALVHESLED